MLANAPRGLMIALSLCVAAVPQFASAAPPWRNLIPFRQVEPATDGEMTLSEQNGPWMILAATFSGPRASRQAGELARELRLTQHWNTYLYEMKFDLSQGTQGRGLNQYGDPQKMKYRAGENQTEIAVMVGDFPAVNDPDAQKMLKKIKLLKPAALANAENSSQTLGSFRNMQHEVYADDHENKKKGPMGQAFVTRNPILPPEYFVPKGIDKLVVQMNDGVTYSLLDCPHKYTVKVATFAGKVIIDQKKISDLEKGLANEDSSLEAAAQKAHLMTITLRQLKYEAYEFHDRYNSIVCIGSYASTGTPRSDGKIEINPAMHKVIKQFGAQNMDLPGRGTQTVPRTLKLPVGADNKVVKVPFDLQPVPVEVPRRSVGSDYSRTASN